MEAIFIEALCLALDINYLQCASVVHPNCSITACSKDKYRYNIVLHVISPSVHHVCH